MSQLEDYPATAYDVEQAKLNWHSGPCALTKDSPAEEVDNWFCLLDHLRTTPHEDWEVVQFDHWACEYVLEVFVRPGSAAEEVCELFAAWIRS